LRTPFTSAVGTLKVDGRPARHGVIHLLLTLWLCTLFVMPIPLLAAITASNLTTGVASSVSSQATASVSLADSKLNTLCVRNNLAGTPNTPTATSSSRTWTQVGTGTNGANTNRMTCFRSMGSAATEAVTIDFAGQSQSVVCWALEEFTGMKTSGSNGADAIVANTGSLTSNVVTYVTGTNTGNSQTLAALSNANNASYGFVCNSTNNTVTVGSGYTVLASATATASRKSEYLVPGSTTVDFTWSSAAITSGMTAIEIAVATAATGGSHSLGLLGVGR